MQNGCILIIQPLLDPLLCHQGFFFFFFFLHKYTQSIKRVEFENGGRGSRDLDVCPRSEKSSIVIKCKCTCNIIHNFNNFFFISDVIYSNYVLKLSQSFKCKEFF